MKKLFKAAAAAVLAFGMAGCAAAQKSGGQTGEEDVVLVGISPGYAPYESKNTSGEIEGFDVDMTKWLFDWLSKNGTKYEYELVEMNFDTIIANLQADQIDLGISGFTYDKDRQGIFSDSYYDSAHVIVVPAESKIASWEDLKGKRVGVQQGSVSEKTAKDIQKAEITSIRDVKTLVEMVNANEIDAVLLDEVVAHHYAKAGGIKIVGEPLDGEANVIYSTKKHQKLMDNINRAIEAFRESSEYPVLTGKWFND